MLIVLILLAVLVTASTGVIKKLKDWLGQFLPEKYRKRYDAFRIAIVSNVVLGMFASFLSDIGIAQAILVQIESTGVKIGYTLPVTFHRYDLILCGFTLSQGSKGIYRIMKRFLGDKAAIAAIDPKKKSPDLDPDEPSPKPDPDEPEEPSE